MNYPPFYIDPKDIEKYRRHRLVGARSDSRLFFEGMFPQLSILPFPTPKPGKSAAQRVCCQNAPHPEKRNYQNNKQIPNYPNRDK